MPHAGFKENAMSTTFRNIGPVERVVRLVIGVGLITAAVVVPGAWWGYIGVVPVLTALVGWCPLYTAIAALRRKRTAS
jgi:hypothetical protein